MSPLAARAVSWSDPDTRYVLELLTRGADLG